MSASAANAGNVFIDFQAETAKFSTGVVKVNAELDGFNKKAGESSGAAESMFPELLGAELAKEVIEKLAEAAVECARKIVELVSEMVDADTKATRMASSLGMSVGALQGLQSAAKIGGGVDAEAFAHALEHMGVSLSKAAATGGEAKDALDRLGLSAKEMRNESPDQAFLKIAESLSHIGNSYDRIKIADDLFGARQAKELLPLLAQGADGIQKFIDGAKKAGVVISDIDAHKVLEAGMATAELKESFEGIVQQLTVAMAPAITAVSKYIKDWIPDAETVRTVFDTVIEYAKPAVESLGEVLKVAGFAVKYLVKDIVAELKSMAPSVDSVKGAFEVATEVAVKGIGAMLDAGHEFKIGFLENAASAAGALESLTGPISDVIDQLVWLHNQLPGADQIEAPHITKQIDDVRQKLEKMADAAGKEPWPSEAVDKFFDELKKAQDDAEEHLKELPKGAADDWAEARKEIHKLQEEAQKKIDTFGMNEIDQKLYDLKQKFGELPASLQPSVDHLKEMSGVLSKMEEDKKAVEEITKMADQGKTAWQKWNDEVQKMGDLLQRGKINQSVYDLAKKKADDDFLKSLHGGDEKQAAAMVRRFDFRMISQASEDPKLDAARKQIELAEKLNDAVFIIQQNTSRDANVANFN